MRKTSENEEESDKVQIRFHKGLVISAINKFYSYDKTKRIDEKLFTAYAKNHPRFRGNKVVRYENCNKPTFSMRFDISGLEEYADFDCIVYPTSYEKHFLYRCF